VLCHADERPDAEGDGGQHYFGLRPALVARVSKLTPTFIALVRRQAPVHVGGHASSEGDEVAGLTAVVHLARPTRPG
jgi:hypothetical protein